jgi:hypothetical protein
MSMAGKLVQPSRGDKLIGTAGGLLVEVVLGSLLEVGLERSLPGLKINVASSAIITGAYIAAFPVAYLAFSFILKGLSGRRRNRERPAESPDPHPGPLLTPEIASVLKEMGIVNATPQLAKSNWEPQECMDRARKSLMFLGTLGTKWVDGACRTEFARFLAGIQARRGKVRFLLINPKGESFKLLQGMRGEPLGVNMVPFSDLLNEYSCLQIRLYDTLPCLRLVFIDGDWLAVSSYVVDQKEYVRANRGWAAPQLIVTCAAPYSLYDAFALYFETLWNASENLT